MVKAEPERSVQRKGNSSRGQGQPAPAAAQSACGSAASLQDSLPGPVANMRSLPSAPAALCDEFFLGSSRHTSKDPTGTFFFCN